MKNQLKILFAVLAVCVLNSCALGMAPVTGSLFSEVSGPIVATTSTGSSKTGTATCQSILGLIATGDCSITSAKKNGNISSVSSVDYKTKNILGLYAEVTTIVKGQ